MNPLYLKNEYEDGTVYFKIDRIDNADDEYIYDGVEIMVEEELITMDEYELTEEDLQEMYDDGFEVVPKDEFEEAERQYQSLDLE